MGWLDIGTTLVGGLLGAAGSKDKKTTSSMDPWAAAQPYMLAGLQRTNDLDRGYQAQPFSDLQKQMYGNQFGDISNFRENIMPGLMGFANQGMSGGYQRGGSVIPGGGGYQRQGAQGGPFGLLAGSGGAPAADIFKTPAVPAANPDAANPLQSGLLGTQPGADGNWGGGPQGGDGTESTGESGSFGDLFGGSNPLANTTPQGWAQALMSGPAAMIAYAAANWGELSAEQKETIAAAYADSSRKNDVMQGGVDGSAGMSMGGAGNFGAGDYGDGTDR